MALDGAGFYMIPEVDNLYMIFYFPMEELLATSIYDWEADSHVYAEYESGKNKLPCSSTQSYFDKN